MWGGKQLSHRILRIPKIPMMFHTVLTTDGIDPSGLNKTQP